MDWVWWLGAALLLAVVEILSVDLVLIMFAGGALVAALLALLDAPLWMQILGFAGTSTLLLFALRPWLLRHLRDRVPLVETNAAANVGRSAVVVAEVSERAGRVKLAGEVWTARTENDEVIPVGEEVTVIGILGATALVTAVPGARPAQRGTEDPTQHDHHRDRRRTGRPTEETSL